MNDRQPIKEEELEWDEDVSVLDGKPYSGIAISVYPGGTLKRKATYRDGFEEGLVQEWYASGHRKEEWWAERGQARGESKAWHENGMLKSLGMFEFGVELQYDEWNEAGDLVVHRVLEDGSTLAEYVQQRREAHSRQL